MFSSQSILDPNSIQYQVSDLTQVTLTLSPGHGESGENKVAASPNCQEDLMR